MSKILKNVLFSVGMFAFVFAIVGALSTNKAEAYARTASVSGAWGDTATWGNNSVPVAGDTVTINAAVTVDVDVTAVAASIVFVDPAAGAGNGLTFTGTNTLTVSGAITVPLSSGVGTTTIAVGTGTLNAGSVSITGGASGIGSMTVSTGSITTTGNFTLAGATAITKALLTSTDADSTISIGGNFVNTLGTVTNVGTMTITGNLTGAGTVINDTNASLHLNGTTNTVTTLTATAGGNTVTYGGTAQTVNPTTANTYYNLILEGSGAKTLTGITTINGMQINGTAVATTAANIAIAANLIVSAGATLHLDAYSFSVGTTSTIYGTVDTTTAATGTKTFSGLVTVYSGGSFSLTAFDPATVFSAGVTNNSATLMNMGSGASTLVGNIGGTGSITWEGALEVLVGGTTTNNNTGTVTVTGTLTLSGGWIQGTNSSLVLGSTTATAGAGTFVATLANTVTYSGAAQTIQTVATPGYYNLILGGSGVKTATASDLIVNQTLTINAGTLSLATANTNTANKLYFVTAYQVSGTWGSTGSATPAATNENDTYFTAAADGMITIATGPVSNSANNGNIAAIITCGPAYTLVNGACVATVVTTITEVTTTTTTEAAAGGCSGGNLFNTSTGAACVNNPTVPVGCGGGKLFSPVNGQACPASANTTVTTTTTTTTTTYNLGTLTLKNGSRGESVKELQKLLNKVLKLGLVEDGKLGPKTIAVIKKWQKDHNLVADGLVGAKTKAAMKTEAEK